MFKENDKALLTTRRIIVIGIEIFAVLSLAMGIVLAILVHGALILTTVFFWFLLWLVWVFVRLVMSYFTDIKFIRNKLYGENKDDLEMFYNKGKREKEKEILEENYKYKNDIAQSKIDK